MHDDNQFVTLFFSNSQGQTLTVDKKDIERLVDSIKDVEDETAKSNLIFMSFNKEYDLKDKNYLFSFLTSKYGNQDVQLKDNDVGFKIYEFYESHRDSKNK